MAARLSQIGLLAAALLCLPFAAQAEWRYAKWGMSKEQLLAASNGKAKPYYEPDPQSWGEYPVAKSPVYEMKHNFEAWFYIDPYDGLYAIRLVPTGGYWCHDIREESLRRWGYRAMRNDGLILNWEVASRNNFVSVIALKGCTIKFEPLDPTLVARD